MSALITAGLSAGCGGSSPAEVTPDLEGCAAAWQEIYGPRPELAPNQILAHGDHLYFNDTSSTTGNTGVIVSVPALGGDATLVSPDTGAFLWAEGGNLLYAPWGDRLQAVPFSGGATMLLQDGGFCGARIGGTCDGVLLDDAFLYFNSFTPTGQGPGGDVVFTRMSRAAGTDEDLATLSGGAPTSLTRLAGDSLLVFLAGRGYVIPRAGEQPRALADQPGGGGRPRRPGSAVILATAGRYIRDEAYAHRRRPLGPALVGEARSISAGGGLARPGRRLGRDRARALRRWGDARVRLVARRARKWKACRVPRWRQRCTRELL